jgi:hypothetical protein
MKRRPGTRRPYWLGTAVLISGGLLRRVSPFSSSAGVMLASFLGLRLDVLAVALLSLPNQSASCLPSQRQRRT